MIAPPQPSSGSSTVVLVDSWQNVPFVIVERDPARPLGPERVRRLCDAATGIGSDGVVEIVSRNGAGASVSRSAMGRYHANHVEALAKYRESQELARQWMAELKENPDGDVAQLVAALNR